MNVAVVIPVYKPKLTWYEKISLAQALKVFAGTKIIFIMPENFVADYIPKGKNFFAAEFPGKYFSSLWGYNALMLNALFYNTFASFDYILLYQLDAFVFENRLAEFCALGYDYYGAPWSVLWGHKPKKFGDKVFLHVGNGGFSLRRPTACLNIINRYGVNWEYGEDCYFSYHGKYVDSSFALAPVNVAYRFAWEFDAVRSAKKTKGVLPFGCHAWQKYSGEFYREILPKFGYDLTGHEKDLQNLDLEDKDYYWGCWASLRLVARCATSLPLMRYLPTLSADERWQMHVVLKSSLALAKRIAQEGAATLDIKMYQENQTESLAAELKKLGTARRLLIKLVDDELIEELRKYGLKERRDYYSFWQEYKRYCLSWVRQNR